MKCFCWILDFWFGVSELGVVARVRKSSFGEWSTQWSPLSSYCSLLLFFFKRAPCLHKGRRVHATIRRMCALGNARRFQHDGEAAAGSSIRHAWREDTK